MLQIIVRSVARDKTNPNHRGKANKNYEQRLEPNDWGGCNTISTVQKDNMVLIIDDLYANREVRAYADYAPNLRAERTGLKVMEDKWTYNINDKKYRIKIRKLTPKECWRLMGMSDEDFEKAEKVNSNTQLYKQAGNSIVVDVLMAVFRPLKLHEIK